MTSRTSLIISGSSAEVGSSKSITFGSIASARAIATRCCWPPESWAGYLLGLVGRRRPGRAARVAALLGLAPCLAAHLDRPERDVLAGSVLWANRLKLWKTMPTSARSRASALPSCGQRLAVERDRARVDRSPAG